MLHLFQVRAQGPEGRLEESRQKTDPAAQNSSASGSCGEALIRMNPLSPPYPDKEATRGKPGRREAEPASADQILALSLDLCTVVYPFLHIRPDHKHSLCIQGIITARRPPPSNYLSYERLKPG